MKKIKILFRKELLDVLRDKKTLVMMVLVPLLLYPLILIGMSMAFSYVYRAQEGQVCTVGYVPEQEVWAEELGGISPSAVLAAVPMLLLTLVVTALLISALCMCICVFARSFKEANNYVMPLMLVLMFAAMAGMLPTIQLNTRTALIPVVNVSLLIKQMIAGRFEFLSAALATAVNLAFSILIIWVLAKLYDSEAILFGDGFGSFRLFQGRSQIRPGTVPGIGDLVIGSTVLLLLMLYVGSAASLRLGFWGTAVMPAVAEELFFRGFLFGSLRARACCQRKKRAGNMLPAILDSALVFGLFHMSLVKFLPTALLGASFAAIVWKTGSIYVTMCLHFVNNAFSMLVLKYPEMLEQLAPVLVKEKLSAPEEAFLLLAGALLAVVGAVPMRGRASE